jgi:Flp pilus assembly protein TadG
MRFHRFIRSQSRRGQALVETALVLPIVVMLLLLGIDLGRVFFTSIDLRNAAHEATMKGGVDPDVTCAELKVIVDRQMGRASPEDAVCGPLSTDVGRVFLTNVACERVDPGPGCAVTPYPADADIRYAVRLEYRFQPVLPFVGLLTGNGMGGSLPIAVENRSPVLVDYEGQ